MAIGEGLPESDNKLAAEDSPQHLDGEKEAIARGDPALVVRGKAAGRNYTMAMGMMFQFLIRTMEHAEEADFTAQMAGIARHLDQRFGTGAEQEIVDGLLVLQGERGLCDIDSRQRFVISYIYDLPFGPGKPFLGGVRGPVKQLVAGWQVNGITTFASGQPLTAYMPGDWANVGGSAYPDLIANPNLSGSKRSPSMYFDTAAFTAPPAGSFGTSGRNNIIGPGINDFDFSLMKNFPITEHQRLEFRAELFNIFYHANFLGPGIDTTFSDPTFGVVSSARDWREIQFGLKFMF